MPPPSTCSTSAVLGRGLTLATRVLAYDATAAEHQELAATWLELDQRLRAGAPYPAAWCCTRTSRTAPSLDSERQRALGTAKSVASGATTGIAEIAKMADDLLTLNRALCRGAALPSSWSGRPARWRSARAFWAYVT